MLKNGNNTDTLLLPDENVKLNEFLDVEII